MVSHISTHLISRSTDCLCSQLHFSKICAANSYGRRRSHITLKQRALLLSALEDRNNVSWRKRQPCLLLLYTVWVPKLRILLIACVDITWSSSHCPAKVKAQATDTNADTLATASAMSHKLSLVSDPRISYLLLVPKKLADSIVSFKVG